MYKNTCYKELPEGTLPGHYKLFPWEWSIHPPLFLDVQPQFWARTAGGFWWCLYIWNFIPGFRSEIFSLFCSFSLADCSQQQYSGYWKESPEEKWRPQSPVTFLVQFFSADSWYWQGSCNFTSRMTICEENIKVFTFSWVTHSMSSFEISFGTLPWHHPEDIVEILVFTVHW